MEPPSKRVKLGPSPYVADDDDVDENQDELTMTPAQFSASQDPMYQLDKGRAKAATRLKSTLEDIFEKYGKDFDGDDDVINFYTDEIEVDNGHLKSLDARDDEGVLSSDEEERILGGKSNGPGKRRQKSHSRSLVPRSRSKHTPVPQLQFNSPWNVAPGLGTYQPSSFPFSSSPFHSPPPFEFGPAPFGSNPIDPVWQAPELPVQPLQPFQPYRQHPSLLGVAGSPFGPFGTRPPLTKRHANTKSFVSSAASTSSRINNSGSDEEDDILCGGNNQEKSPNSRPKVTEKISPPVTDSVNTNQSSQSPNRQPPFHGLVNSSVHNQPDKPSEEGPRDRDSEPFITETLPAPSQPAEGNLQPRQTEASSRSLSPARRRRGRSKKIETHESAASCDQAPKTKTHPLQPNERRIEIIIPMMKHLFPGGTEAEQSAEHPALVVDEAPRELQPKQRICTDESSGVPHLQDNIGATSPMSRNGNVPFHQPSPDPAEESQHTNGELTVEASESPKNISGPTWIQTVPPILDTPSHNEHRPQNIGIRPSQEPKAPETVAAKMADNSIPELIHQMEQKSGCNHTNDVMASGPLYTPTSDVTIDNHMARNVGTEQHIETTLMEDHNPGRALRSVSPTDALSGDASSSNTKSVGAVRAVAAVFGRVISQGLEGVRNGSADFLQDSAGLAPVDPPMEEDTVLTDLYAPNHEASHEVHSDERSGVAEIGTPNANRIFAPEQAAGTHSPQHPAIHETTESDPHASEDRLPISFDLSETREDQKRNASDSPSVSSVPLAETNDPEPGSDHQDTQRSASPEAKELPDHDLSAFPAEPATHSTPELVFRPSSPEAQVNSTQDISHTGKSPSPELGTPVEPKIVSTASSRSKDSPTPKTPSRKRGRPRGSKSNSSHHRSPPSKRFPLSSLIPGGIDDESDDELSIAGSFSSTTSRFHSPFSRTSTNDNIGLPPLFSTPRKTTRTYGVLASSPSSSRTPNRIAGLDSDRRLPPATESRAGRAGSQRARNRAVHSSPLARTVAARLLSSPTKKYRVTPPQRAPSSVASPHGTLRRCGEGGFVCERDFCLTCCK